MDIELKEKELENIIITLENDNKDMLDTINNIYEMMTKIDKNDWDSPEKTRLDEGFVPYLKRQSDVLKSELFNKTDLLKQALDAYRKQNKDLKKEAQDLEVL